MVHKIPLMCCEHCDGDEFSIGNDRIFGVIVICNGCHCIMGNIVYEDNLPERNLSE